MTTFQYHNALKLLSVALPFITFLQLTFDIEGVNVQLIAFSQVTEDKKIRLLCSDNEKGHVIRVEKVRG